MKVNVHWDKNSTSYKTFELPKLVFFTQFKVSLNAIDHTV